MKLFFRQKMLMGGRHRITYKTENYILAKAHKLKLKKNIFYKNLKHFFNTVN